MRHAADGSRVSALQVATMIASGTGLPACGERLGGGARPHRGDGLPGRDPAALADPGALDDPGVRGLDHRLHVGVGEHAVGQVRTEGEDLGHRDGVPPVAASRWRGRGGRWASSEHKPTRRRLVTVLAPGAVTRRRRR